MWDEKIVEIQKKDFPELLKEIHDCPKTLHVLGQLPDPKKYIYICIVGTRTPTTYGEDACRQIVRWLAGYPVCIISGLALGTDGIVHDEALRNNIKTVGIPGSGLSEKKICPRTNFYIAKRILESGSALVSEFANDFQATRWSFPARNRIMAGLSKAVILIEAKEKSGTLITARLAMEYNRDVLVVPGSIFSSKSKGTNALIVDGAIPIISKESLLEALGLKIEDASLAENIDLDAYELSPDEKAIWAELDEPKAKSDILKKTGFDVSRASVAITLLEIKDLVIEENGVLRKSQK